MFKSLKIMIMMEKIIAPVMRYVEAEEVSSWHSTVSDGNWGAGGGSSGGVGGCCTSYTMKIKPIHVSP